MSRIGWPDAGTCSTPSGVASEMMSAPRAVFLIHAAPGMGGEDVRQPKYYAAAGQPKQLWKVPGADHTGGLKAQPAEYERRVVDFYDRALLDG